MAARRLRLSVKDDEAWRARIQTTMLSKRLNDHAQGRVEMSATQVRAAEILLRKVVPDLSRISGPGDAGSHILQIKHEMT